MLAKPQGFPRKLGGCAGLDPRLRSAVSAGVGDGERGLRRGLRAPGVGVRPKWVLEYSPSNKRIRYFVSITYVRTGLWTAHKFCGGGKDFLPVREDQVPCDQDAAALISMSEQGEQHLHLVTAVLDITDIVNDERLELVESLEFLLQPELGLGAQEPLDEQRTGSEVGSPALQDEFMPAGTP